MESVHVAEAQAYCIKQSIWAIPASHITSQTDTVFDQFTPAAARTKLYMAPYCMLRTITYHVWYSSYMLYMDTVFLFYMVLVHVMVVFLKFSYMVLYMVLLRAV